MGKGFKRLAKAQEKQLALTVLQQRCRIGGETEKKELHKVFEMESQKKLIAGEPISFKKSIEVDRLTRRVLDAKLGNPPDG